jgi:hypothetical protein
LHSPKSVQTILELSYLIDGPVFRQGGEGNGDRAGVVIVVRRLLAPQRDPSAEFARSFIDTLGPDWQER